MRTVINVIHALMLCLLPMLGTLHAADVQPLEKPNIVIILADDMGFGDLSCYGATKITTPHIDRLAKEGMRFTQALTPSSVCSPTRVRNAGWPLLLAESTPCTDWRASRGGFSVI